MKLNESIIKNLFEGELHTVDNDPAWAAAVAKVKAEYEEEKPEISKDIEEEFKQFKKDLLQSGFTEESIKTMPEVKAYEDAIADPDDIWCECGSGEDLYKEDGDVYLGVDKHGYICSNCMKYTQIG